jgi:bacteriocin-like protein
MSIRTLTNKELKQVAGGGEGIVVASRSADGIVVASRKPEKAAKDGVIFGD